MFENIEVHFCKWLHIYDNLHSVYTMNSTGSQILRQQTKSYIRSTKDINLSTKNIKSSCMQGSTWSENMQDLDTYFYYRWSVITWYMLITYIFKIMPSKFDWAIPLEIHGHLQTTIYSKLWHYILSPFITWHYILSPFITWHYIIYPFITWHYILSPFITWHYILSPFITVQLIKKFV